MKHKAEYAPHLIWIDSLTAEVMSSAPIAGPTTDNFRADLAGLLSTAYVAAYECSIKAIFLSFATKKNRLLASMTGYHFEKINSKIHWQTIADGYLKQYGEIYRAEYYSRLSQEEMRSLRDSGISIKETYANLLKWRHAFAHEGKKIATLEEVVASKDVTKIVISCLDEALSI